MCVSEIHKTFSPLGAAFSAGAAWSGARRDPSESPQPGAIPTTARASRLKALWDQNFPPRHSQATCSNRFQSLPRCLDYFDGKLACGLVFPTVKDFASRQQVEACLSFSKFCNSDFVQNMFDRWRDVWVFAQLVAVWVWEWICMPASPRSIATFFQQIALVCLWALWLIHFRKFCIFHQVSIDSQAYQHLPARDPASHWAASYHHLSISPVSLRSIEPEIGASNYQTVQTGRVSIWPPQYSKSADLASGIGSLPESITRSGPLIVLPSNCWRKNNDLFFII